MITKAFRKFLETTTTTPKKPYDGKKVTEIKFVNSEMIKNEMFKELGIILDNSGVSLINEEVDKFKSDNEAITTKGSLLNKFGFTKTPTAQLARSVEVTVHNKSAILRQKESAQELAKNYAFEYPGYKFVTDEIFDRVREKYNLFTGEPKKYIKEIPDENVNDLNKFMVMNDENQEYHAVSMWMYHNREVIQNTGDFFIVQGIHSPNLSGTKEECEKYISEHNKKAKDRQSRVDLAIEETKILITAPLDHFDLNRSEIKGRDIVDIKVDDPIITKKVKGGHIIITAWDKEADIPEIKM